MSGFQLRTATEAETSSMILIGEADLAVADGILQEGTTLLANDATRCLVIDLAAVTFVDSTTLGTLIRLRNIAIAAGKQLALARLPKRVQRVIEIAGLAGVFDVASDEP
jgi:anti-anti-sigma factor